MPSGAWRYCWRSKVCDQLQFTRRVEFCYWWHGLRATSPRDGATGGGAAAVTAVAAASADAVVVVAADADDTAVAVAGCLMRLQYESWIATCLSMVDSHKLQN